MPPLFPDSLDLAAAVNSAADVAGLDPRERRAALTLLGQLIADGQTNHVETIRTVVDVLNNNRGRLLEIAAQEELELERRRGVARKRVDHKPKSTRPRTDVQQRYDLETEPDLDNPL